ncbi:hypothetical protein PG990_010908 [Apiospora arundinis]
MCSSSRDRLRACLGVLRQLLVVLAARRAPEPPQRLDGGPDGRLPRALLGLPLLGLGQQRVDVAAGRHHALQGAELVVVAPRARQLGLGAPREE